MDYAIGGRTVVSVRRVARVQFLAILALCAACMPTDSYGMWTGAWDSISEDDHGFEYADWPNAMLFQYSNFGTVKTALEQAGGGNEGSGTSKMWMIGNQVDDDIWKHGSTGSKDQGPWRCTWLNYDWRHMRYYGDPAYGSASSAVYGSLVVGTAHYDLREHCGNAEYGYTEWAEYVWRINLHCRGYDIEDYVASVPETAGDYQRRNNPRYRWLSDGTATVIKMGVETDVRCDLTF
jgi:hypothetical protein